MQVINITNQDLMNLKRATFNSDQANYYFYGDRLLKVYKAKNESLNKQRIDQIVKLNAIRGIKELTLPKDLVLDKQNNLLGYTMDYFDEAVSLDAYAKIDKQATYQLLLKLSKALKQIHQNQAQVVLGTLSPTSILVDPALRLHCLKCDAYQLGDGPLTKAHDQADLIMMTLSLLEQKEVTLSDPSQYYALANHFIHEYNLEEVGAEIFNVYDQSHLNYIHNFLPPVLVKQKK